VCSARCLHALHTACPSSVPARTAHGMPKLSACTHCTAHGMPKGNKYKTHERGCWQCAPQHFIPVTPSVRLRVRCMQSELVTLLLLLLRTYTVFAKSRARTSRLRVDRWSLLSATSLHAVVSVHSTPVTVAVTIHMTTSARARDDAHAPNHLNASSMISPKTHNRNKSPSASLSSHPYPPAALSPPYSAIEPHTQAGRHLRR
jgi:hypothetical protein